MRIRYLQTMGAVMGIPGYEVVSVIEITNERPKSAVFPISRGSTPVVLEFRRPHDVVLNMTTKTAWVGGV